MKQIMQLVLLMPLMFVAQNNLEANRLAIQENRISCNQTFKNTITFIIKNLISRGLLLIMFFYALGADAQIDYGTIKLYNSLTDEEILSISNGATYDLNIVGDSLNIVAEPPYPASVSSVVFTTSIGENTTENIPPYAFKKDNGTDYYSWPTLPNYLDSPISFTITYWSVDDGAGTQVGDDVFTITFTKPTLDTQDPTAPSLTSTGQTQTAADLSWNGATDNVDVIGYKVYKAGILEATLGNVGTYQVTGLTASTTYSFTVTALDAAGNESIASNSVSVTTDSGSGGGGSSVWTEAGSVASYSGDVAIGTSTVPSGYKLAVDGHIRTREIRVDQDNWPDYVFTEGYDLPTLEEIKKHIEEKGHLPNIPSAEEVKSNGVELGKMDRLLLKKIEELTLYVLHSNELHEVQRNINNQVKKELETLKKLINEKL